MYTQEVTAKQRRAQLSWKRSILSGFAFCGAARLRLLPVLLVGVFTSAV